MLRYLALLTMVVGLAGCRSGCDSGPVTDKKPNDNPPPQPPSGIHGLDGQERAGTTWPGSASCTPALGLWCCRDDKGTAFLDNLERFGESKCT